MRLLGLAVRASCAALFAAAAAAAACSNAEARTAAAGAPPKALAGLDASAPSPPSPVGPSPRAPAADGSASSGAIAPATLSVWMREQVTPALEARDFTAVAADLDQMAPLAPPEYPNWASIARDGASAALVGDVEAVEAACRGCHSQYAGRYRAEGRDRSR